MGNTGNLWWKQNPLKARCVVVRGEKSAVQTCLVFIPDKLNRLLTNLLTSALHISLPTLWYVLFLLSLLRRFCFEHKFTSSCSLSRAHFFMHISSRTLLCAHFLVPRASLMRGSVHKEVWARKCVWRVALLGHYNYLHIRIQQTVLHVVLPTIQLQFNNFTEISWDWKSRLQCSGNFDLRNYCNFEDYFKCKVNWVSTPRAATSWSVHWEC